jgi:superfamily II DNA/RNA helicase
MTVLSIDQVYYEVERRFKLEALCRIIDLQDVKLGIVFCATKMMVDELTEHLIARGYAADKLHGDMTQAMRERVMNRFRQRKVEFLVATDVAARGLDVDDIEVVFQLRPAARWRGLRAPDRPHRTRREKRARNHVCRRPRDLQAAEHLALHEGADPPGEGAVDR